MILDHIIWYYLILFDMIWYYLILFDIIWYYLIFFWYHFVLFHISWYVLIWSWYILILFDINGSKTKKKSSHLYPFRALSNISNRTNAWTRRNNLPVRVLCPCRLACPQPPRYQSRMLENIILHLWDWNMRMTQQTTSTCRNCQVWPFCQDPEWQSQTPCISEHCWSLRNC